MLSELHHADPKLLIQLLETLWQRRFLHPQLVSILNSFGNQSNLIFTVLQAT